MTTKTKSDHVATEAYVDAAVLAGGGSVDAHAVMANATGASATPTGVLPAALSGGTPTTTDVLLGWESSGELRKFSVGDLSAGLGLAAGDVSGLGTAATADTGDFAAAAHAASHKSAGGDSIRLDEFAAPSGSVNFNDQQATSFRIENRTSDPASPTVGQLWLRTDL